MPSQVWLLYEANPRDFLYLSAYGFYESQRKAAAQQEADAQARHSAFVRQSRQR